MYDLLFFSFKTIPYLEEKTSTRKIQNKSKTHALLKHGSNSSIKVRIPIVPSLDAFVLIPHKQVGALFQAFVSPKPKAFTPLENANSRSKAVGQNYR